MILPIPSILIKNGRNCVPIAGEPGTEDLYSEFCGNEAKLLGLLRRENSKSVHLHYYNGTTERPDNIAIETISELPKVSNFPLSLFCDFSDYTICQSTLDAGFYRIILKDLLVNSPESIKILRRDYSNSRVCIFADIEGDNCYFCNKTISISIDDLCEKVLSFSLNRIMLHSKDWISTISDDGISRVANISNRHPGVRFTLFGGAIIPNDLHRLNLAGKSGIDSVILLDSFYKNCFPCQKLWRICEKELEPNLINRRNTL